MNQLVYQYWLLSNDVISSFRKIQLIEYFYNSFNIYNASKKELLDSQILKEDVIDAFIASREDNDIFKEYEAFYKSPFEFITMESENYPQKLINIYDGAYGFFYNGKLPDFNNCVSLVGARRCSAYGKKVANDLSNKLAKEGFTIISGMARGIDTYSHRGCLDGGGKTVAVLGSGCDVIYPSENYRLYEEIIINGAVISEYKMGTAPLAANFPRRNRIVSALSDVVIVIEAREKSGSLITADLALDQGKDIYVVPGRIGDSLSLGCNRLISQGAGIIYSVDDFVKELAERCGKNISIERKVPEKIVLNPIESKIFEKLDLYPKSIATLVEECNIDYLSLLSVVYSLEKQGLIYEVFKNNYVKYR